MTHTITANIYQTSPGAYFRIVEKTVWKFASGGAWGEVNGSQVLKMNASGTSGALRLRTEDTGEEFLIALGVHNFKRWGDIVTDLSGGDTGMLIHPQYYEGSDPVVKEREVQRDRQLVSYNVNSVRGRNFAFNYAVADADKDSAHLPTGETFKFRRAFPNKCDISPTPFEPSAVQLETDEPVSIVIDLL